jgi:hypothetical protein
VAPQGTEPLFPPQVRFVDNFAALVTTPFSGAVNALCWPRVLPGDFREIVDALGCDAGMTTIGDDDLQALTLSRAGSVARDVLLADQALLRDRGLAPILDCITGYPRDDAAGPMPTDVYSFHVDSAPVLADTWLCTYIGASSEGLANAQALRRIDDPATRAVLLQAYGGADDAGFASYLTENHFDLHFAATDGATPYSFGLGNLWRIAIATPDSPVLPCIHRAPQTLPGAPARLLLIS